MKPILWLSSKAPLPLHDGGRLATHALISGLAEAGLTIDLLCATNTDDEFAPSAVCTQYGCRSAHHWRRQGTFRTISNVARLRHLVSTPCTALTFHGFAGPGYRHSLAALLKHPPTSEGWGVVVYDGLHPAAHALSWGRFTAAPGKLPSIYRAHNVECDLWRDSAQSEKEPLKRWALKLQAKLVERFEKSMAKRVDGVAAISLEVLTRLQSWGAHGRAVPMGVDFDAPLPFSKAEHLTVGFLGRLDWPPNYQGMDWFLNQVWPEICRTYPNYRLLIGGSGKLPSACRLNQKGVEFIGQVSDVRTFYTHCHLLLCPVFVGSGVRVKALEAARFGRAVISTPKGIEGLPLTHHVNALVGSSVSDWLQLFKDLSIARCEALGRAAFDHLKTSFSRQSATQQFLQLYQDVLKAPEGGTHVA